MSEFSELLKLHMKRSNVSMVDIAAYCGTERTTIYKFSNGTRTPSSYATVKKIADYLRLTHSERRTFIEKYMIAVVGERVYERRKKARDFIRLFSSSYSHQYAPMETQASDIEEPGEQKRIVQGTSCIICAIHQELLREARSENGVVKVAYDPLDKALTHVFINVLGTNPSLRFSHVIGIYNESVSELSEGRNLEALSNTIPLCMANSNYECFYEYRNYAGRDAFPIFKGVVVTSHAVIMFNEELTSAAIFHEEEFIRFYQEQFEIMEKRCTKLFLRNDNMLAHDRSQDTAFLESIQGETIKYRLQPFMVAMYDEMMLRKCLFRSELEKENAEWIVSYVKRLRETLAEHRPLVVMSLDEVREFMDTGFIGIIPRQAQSKLEMEERLKVLDKLIKVFEKTNVKVFNKENESNLGDLSMWVTMNSIKMFFKTPQDVFYLSVKEPGLVDTFRDYLGNIEPWLFYDEKEALSLLRKLRNEYAKK